MFKNLKSSYFIKFIFMNIHERKKLKIIQYNKNLQKILDINSYNYKIISGKYIIFEAKENCEELLKDLKNDVTILMRGTVDYEFRTTVVKGLHTRESLLEAARWIAGAKESCLQQYKDSGDLLDPRGLGPFNNQEMHTLRDAVAEILPCVQLRGVD